MGAKFTVRGVVFSALFAALLVVFSYVNINLGFSPVPITLSNMAAILAGAMLGAWYGFFSMLLVVVLTMLGLPMWHGSGGIGLVAGPTGGFIVMYPICALIAGIFASRMQSNSILSIAALFLGTTLGTLALYVGGVPWLAYVADYSLQKALAGGFYPFILGDLFKIVLTVAIVVAVRSVYPPSRLVGAGGSKVVKF